MPIRISKGEKLRRAKEAEEIIRRLKGLGKYGKTRRLSAIWGIEAVKDLTNVHGFDLEAEISGALSAAIAEEIDKELLESLKKGTL